jgi:hypothetical protein
MSLITDLKFYPDYFLQGVEPAIEDINVQINRLRNETRLSKVNDQFNPSIDDFRKYYSHPDLSDSRGNTILHQLVRYNRHIKYFTEALKTVDTNKKMMMEKLFTSLPHD